MSSESTQEQSPVVQLSFQDISELRGAEIKINGKSDWYKSRQLGFYALALALIQIKLLQEEGCRSGGVNLWKKSNGARNSPIDSLDGKIFSKFSKKVLGLKISDNILIADLERFPEALSIKVGSTEVDIDSLRSIQTEIGKDEGRARWVEFEKDDGKLDSVKWKDWLDWGTKQLHNQNASDTPQTSELEPDSVTKRLIPPNYNNIEKAFPTPFQKLVAIFEENQNGIRDEFADAFQIDLDNYEDSRKSEIIAAELHCSYLKAVGTLRRLAEDEKANFPKDLLFDVAKSQLLFALAPTLAADLRKQDGARRAEISNRVNSVIATILLRWIVGENEMTEVQEKSETFFEPLVCPPQQQEEELTQTILKALTADRLTDLGLSKESSDQLVRGRFNADYWSDKPVSVVFEKGDPMIKRIQDDEFLKRVLVVLEVDENASINPDAVDPDFEKTVEILVRDFFKAIESDSENNRETS